MNLFLNSKPRIIVLDDSASNLEFLKENLRDDFDLELFNQKSEFLKKFKSLNADVILLDIVLSDGNGYDLCRKIKETYTEAELPVIFMTSLEGSYNEELGFEAGAVDYVKKPLNVPILKARLRTHAELKRMRDYLKEQSLHDGLTGIFNKRAFQEVLRIAWIKALRSKNPLSILIMDIDFFKGYNDFYGHLKGDECLVKVSGLIDSVKPADSTFFRFGGEEFVLLLENCTLEKAQITAGMIQKEIKNAGISHEKSSVAAYLTLSIGIGYTIARSANLPEELVGKADEALYEAKKAGRNQIKEKELSD